MKRPGFHWAHNYVYDHFGRELGAFGYGVYMGLCRYADNEGRSCFPSYGRIADDLGISRRGVIMAVNKMQALGIIEKAVRLDGGPQLTNVFTLCYDHDMAADRVNKVHPPEETRCTPTGECSAPPPVNVVHPPSVPGAPLYKEVQKDLLKKTQVEEVGAREAREAGPPPPPPPPIACATFEPEPDGVYDPLAGPDPLPRDRAAPSDPSAKWTRREDACVTPLVIRRSKAIGFSGWTVEEFEFEIAKFRDGGTVRADETVLEALMRWLKNHHEKRLRDAGCLPALARRA